MPYIKKIKKLLPCIYSGVESINLKYKTEKNNEIRDWDHMLELMKFIDHSGNDALERHLEDNGEYIKLSLVWNHENKRKIWRELVIKKDIYILLNFLIVLLSKE